MTEARSRDEAADAEAMNAELRKGEPLRAADFKERRGVPKNLVRGILEHHQDKVKIDEDAQGTVYRMRESDAGLGS